MSRASRCARRWSGEPSYTDVVYDVLRDAKRPLPFAAVSDAVNRRRPVAAKHPKHTIRNVLSQGPQLISLSDGRFGYLSYLMQSNLLRVPLAEKKPANPPLRFSVEVLHALWPSFVETEARAHRGPVQLRLPDGGVVTLSLDLLHAVGVWGSPMPEGLRRLLERAQDLMYDARETFSPRERVRLARRALDMSPHCADAYGLLAEEIVRSAHSASRCSRRTPGTSGASSRRVPTCGRGWGWPARRGPPESGYRRSHTPGSFSGSTLATTRKCGTPFSPSYSSGARTRAAQLLERYANDGAAEWLYGRALHAFRAEGDTRRARKLRAAAKRGNAHVPSHLQGKKRLPRRRPALIGMGDEREAVVCAADQMAAWRATPGAPAWLELANP